MRSHTRSTKAKKITVARVSFSLSDVCTNVVGPKKGGRGNGGKCSLREGEKEGGEEKEFKTETEGHTRVPNAQSQRKGTGLNKSILKGFFSPEGDGNSTEFFVVSKHILLARKVKYFDRPFRIIFSFDYICEKRVKIGETQLSTLPYKSIDDEKSGNSDRYCLSTSREEEKRFYGGQILGIAWKNLHWFFSS